jgi:hypothetical protein
MTGSWLFNINKESDMGAKGKGQFTEYVGFRAPREHVKAVDKIAKVRGVKDSVILRESLERYLTTLKVIVKSAAPLKFAALKKKAPKTKTAKSKSSKK